MLQGVSVPPKFATASTAYELAGEHIWPEPLPSASSGTTFPTTTGRLVIIVIVITKVRVVTHENIICALIVSAMRN
jgi:hypothetical protein